MRHRLSSSRLRVRLHTMKRVPYIPPSWAASLSTPKSGRVPFAALPTPVVPWACPLLDDLGIEWWIKRDDFSGVEMSGNKARKLEFLMAEALDGGHDCVVTIGGLQSNHCRATAAAARQVGLEPHLVLLVRDKELDNEVGLTGNLMVERMLGARLHLCAGSDYLRYGGDLAAMDKLNAAAAAQLSALGRKPYVVPVGGTTPTGSWGYINAVQELIEQMKPQQPPATTVPGFDHIVVAAGSGGTAAGLALGVHLSPLTAQLHAVNVQHKPEAYYDIIDTEAAGMGSSAPPGSAREWLSIYDGGRLGYGVTNKEELEMIARVGAASGVLLDHVYTGKALFHFAEHARSNPEQFRGKRILFWHTGGLPGLQARSQELLGLLEPAVRLRLP